MAHQTIAEFQSQRLLPIRKQKGGVGSVLGTKPLSRASHNKKVSKTKQYLLDAIAKQMWEKYDASIDSDLAVRMYNKWIKSNIATTTAKTSKVMATIIDARSATLQKFLFHIKHYA